MLPEAFVTRMRETLGTEYDAFEATFEREPYRALRANALKENGSGGNAAELFANKEPQKTVPTLRPVDWAKDGYYYEADTAPGKHPFHEAGVYYIQEPSAMAPVPLLDPQCGERILDLCAAPGGKSTQIAARMNGSGLLVSNEINPQRARILSENVERMGIRNALVTNETPEHLAQFFPGFFQRILVDAPCSGEGMFRKNTDAQTEWSPENVALCAQRQDHILDQAATMCEPGGRIVYSTCTFAFEEDEGSVARFLERHPDFSCTLEKRIWPHKLDGEGHFMAVLEKGGTGYEAMPKSGFLCGEKWKSLREFPEFAQSTLSESFYEELQRNASHSTTREGEVLSLFGENLYLHPMYMPNLKGLKVLRPGLCLGEFKKGRFEPSHALAMAISAAQCKHSFDMSLQEAADYLKGMSLAGDGEKGWFLMTVCGYSLGWGKLSAGIMKNHYPKGLRK